MTKIGKEIAKTTVSDLNEYLSVLQEHVVLIEGAHFQVNLDLWDEEDEPASENPTWREYTRNELISALAAEYVTKKEAQTLISMLQSHKKTRVVKPAYEKDTLPLRPAGYQMIDGAPWFIRNESKPLEPVKGNPSPILRQICRMFGNEAPLFIGWLKGAYTRQLNFAAEARGMRAPYKKVASQTLAIAGNKGAGKTHVLLDIIIVGLLGKYTNMPASWLSGASRFNDWALDSNIWVADDSIALQSIRERKQAATILKQAGYSSRLTIECKNKAVINMDYPCERIFIVNLEDSALRALPAYEENTDKYLFLHNCAPSGLLEDWGGDIETMEKNLQDAIPAFAYWLLNDYVLPEWATRDTNRHTVADYSYMSPPVLQALSELDESGILLAKLRKCYMHPHVMNEVRNVFLTQEKLRYFIDAVDKKAELSTTTKMGIQLRVCVQRYPHLIAERVYKGYREYCLKRDVAWENPVSMNTSHCSIAQPDPILLEQAGLPHDFNPVPPRHEPEPQDELPHCA